MFINSSIVKDQLIEMTSLWYLLQLQRWLSRWVTRVLNIIMLGAYIGYSIEYLSRLFMMEFYKFEHKPGNSTK